VTTTQPRRSYDSTLRRERAAQTRENIVTAGAELVRASSIRDWRGVTIRAVAERAGVNERTVYRHFANERALRDAVMHRLESDAGVDLAEMKLEDFATVTARVLRYHWESGGRSIPRLRMRADGNTTPSWPRSRNARRNGRSMNRSGLPPCSTCCGVWRPTSDW
jgi:AcrR family transcriptional regulator